MKLFNSTFDLMEKSMDLRVKRHAVLAGNVANSETPNYRARDLDFAGQLEQALGTKDSEVVKTNPMHLDLSGTESAHTVADDSGAMGADGNNVDLDLAMGRLSQNSRAYSNAASWLGVQLRLLKTAARGRAGQ